MSDQIVTPDPLQMASQHAPARPEVELDADMQALLAGLPTNPNGTVAAASAVLLDDMEEIATDFTKKVSEADRVPDGWYLTQPPWKLSENFPDERRPETKKQYLTSDGKTRRIFSLAGGCTKVGESQRYGLVFKISFGHALNQKGNRSDGASRLGAVAVDRFAKAVPAGEGPLSKRLLQHLASVPFLINVGHFTGDDGVVRTMVQSIKPVS